MFLANWCFQFFNRFITIQALVLLLITQYKKVLRMPLGDFLLITLHGFVGSVQFKISKEIFFTDISWPLINCSPWITTPSSSASEWWEGIFQLVWGCYTDHFTAWNLGCCGEQLGSSNWPSPPPPWGWSLHINFTPKWKLSKVKILIFFFFTI
jgi:hypothetical protein